ncbi:MAG: hypothetical protein K6G26_14175 [Lachnospiraceae bacterium]|nr:hypothetical protein [Lachnospiraceae bacterium]
MEEANNLLIGFDLCNDYSQIACFNNITFEPEIIRYELNSENELLKTVMAVRNDTKEWLFADDAVKFIEEGKAAEVSDIVDSVINGNKIKIFDSEFEPIDILSKYFRKTLSLIKKYHPNDVIAKLVVTIENTNVDLINGIFEALEKLGISKERVSVQSHSQSFVYYALSRSKELWMNDIVLFHFDIHGLKFYQIKLDRRHRPIIVATIYKDLSEALNYKLIEEKHELQAKMLFKDLSEAMLHKQIITAAYLTGKGFEGKWYEEVVYKWLGATRVFKGVNLFAEGACYAAKEYYSGGKFDDFLIMNEDMISTTILVNAYYDAKESEMIFTKVATAWYEVDKSQDFILNDTNEVEVIVIDNVKNTRKSFIIAIDLMNARPNKTTRIRMRVRFLDVKTCVVTIRDLGFGDFYPATNRVWEKIIEI